MRIAAALLAIVLLTGCIRIQIDPPGDNASGASPDGAPQTKPLGALKVDFTWSPAAPRTGQDVKFQATVDGLGTGDVKGWNWSFGDGAASTVPSPTHQFAKAGEWAVNLSVLATDGRTAQVTRRPFVFNQGDPVSPANQEGNQSNDDAAPPPTPGVFDCGGTQVLEPFDTFGRDESLPGLAWASLKTGFRFAVAWSTELPTAATLRYAVAGGSEQSITETVPTRLHLFVLDGLPEGKSLCFVAGTAPLHAVRLANAMTAFQPGEGNGTYVVNSLVLVNEGGDMAEVEAGFPRYAEMLWDSTDGWVRAGAVLVIAGDYMHHNSGWASCYVTGANTPLCNQVFDVIVTEDAFPQGAASTYRKGVTDPDVAMWMNMHWQAMPGPVSMDDFGSVLVHESGHYLFDMDDLYGDPVVPDSQDCDVPRDGISIMGGGRETTEFDDEAHPCPTQGSDYVPSWTLMRGQFPAIPERASIDPGPSGNGGLFFLQTYRGP
ncbi:MAG: PKD domain-containing protein [Candidatus Thermoplasmatota archaeon]